MAEHATRDQFIALERRELDAAAAAELMQHVSACRSCARLASETVDMRGATDGVMRDAHPDLEDELFAYVEGSLDDETRKSVEEHLVGCARCREDVEDARTAGFRPAPARRPRRAYVIGALAAAAMVIVVGSAVLQRRVPSPSPLPASRPQAITTVTHTAELPQRRADWQALVDDAFRRGKIDVPDVVRSVRAERDLERGKEQVAQNVTLNPSSIVVSSTTPELQWPNNLGTVVVTVFDDTRLVVESKPLSTNRWTPTKPLTRGRVYSWQLQVSDGRVIPTPPDPPALFTIIDEKTAHAIEEARMATPSDPLVIAILESRAGLRREALTDFDAALTQQPADAARIHALASSVRAW